MFKRVIMAEKKDAAENIAKAIQLTDIKRTGKSGFIHGMDKEGSLIVITWSNGHCVGLEEPGQIDPRYEKWDLNCLPVPLVSDKKLNVNPDKKTLFYDIREELQNADDLVNAGDAGREGELIQRWIAKSCGWKKSIHRLWVQSMAEKSIRKAYDNLLGARDEEEAVLDHLYDSGRARAIMDKYIGYNYSRLITLTRTDGVTVPYGRCKSPLIHAIVERDLEVENFVSVPFSYIQLELKGGEGSFIATLVDQDKRRRTFTEGELENLKEVTEHLSDRAKVVVVSREKKYSLPPLPLDTLQIQKEMANRFGYDADKTLNILEELYNKHKILTYPRTDTRFYSLDLKDELNAMIGQLGFGEFDPFAKMATGRFILDRCFNDKKIADHHALAPCVPENTSLQEAYEKLTNEEKNVYRVILMNFLALFLPNHEYESIEIQLDNAGHIFLARGKNVLKQGFKVIYAKEEENDDTDDDDEKADQKQKLPALNENDIISVSDIIVKDSKTKPKSRFTTSTLLDYMKVYNIGTGATRDRLIKELTEKAGRNKDSAVRKDGKFYVSTPFGREMDSVIPEHLKSIEHLKYLERSVTDIADGKLRFDDFIRSIEQEFSQDLSHMKSDRQTILVSEKKNKNIREDMSCPVCKSPLVEHPWGFACSEWKKDKSGCNFSIGKEVFNKKLSDKMIMQLLTNGKTKSKIKGLKGRSGKPFDAVLKLEIGEGGKSRVAPVFD